VHLYHDDVLDCVHQIVTNDAQASHLT